MDEFDLAVIGAGAAGLSVTAIAAQLGVRVALIERDRMGGDCLHHGCVPSKALLAAGHAAQAARQAGRFGIHLPAPEIDWAAVQDRVAAAIAAIEPADSAERFRALGATVIHGDARFTAPDTLEVNSARLRARRIVIAAGSSPAVPPLPGLDRIPFLTTEALWSLSHRPDHLLILGGGPVGLEMADAHAALGCRVTVVEAARIGGREDPELAGLLRAALTGRGIAVLEGVPVQAAEPGPTLVLADGRRIAGSHLLVATGRRPRLDGLGLEAGQVRATAVGVTTDRGLRSVSNRRVFAVGDIADPEGIGPRAFTHLALHHAGIVIRRALFRLPARLGSAPVPRVIYTNPELAQVGLTEAEARARGHRVTILRASLDDNDRARTDLAPPGLIKLVAAHGRVLGAGILGPHAGEMITAWTLAVARGIPLSALAELIVPYPTLSEAGKRAAQRHFAPRLFAPGTRSLVRLLARLP